MAPMAPRSRKRDAAKPATRKTRAAKTQPDSGLQLARQQSELQDSDIENEDPDMDMQIAPSQAVALPQQDPLHTLQEMADRLGREVESFAELMDKFLDNESDRTEELYDSAHDMVLSFKEEALEKVNELSEECGRDRRELLARDWVDQARLSLNKSSTSNGALMKSMNTGQIDQLKRAQEEADTWDLFRIVLEHHYQPNMEELREQRIEILREQPVHRYTSEDTIFHRFLQQDESAQQQHDFKMWLEQTAEHQQSHPDPILKELERKSGGSATFTRGWMHTREKIKGEKRLRTWPKPDSSPLPQVRSVDSNELLVTALDLDATTRQHRTLERPDEYNEKALWIACWQMLRQGWSWPDICSWCEERKEGWRAMLIGRDTTESGVPSLAAWRQACFRASTSQCSSDYEAAVYGYLGGNASAMQRVCHTVDDKLFAYYSARLSQSFDRYLMKHYPERLPPGFSPLDDDNRDQDTAVADLIRQLRTNPSTKSESVLAMKVIQSYLLANQLENLIHTTGCFVGELNADKDDSRSLYFQDGGVDGITRDAPEAELARDTTCLRIITHISILLKVLNRANSDRPKPTPIEQGIEDNILVSYLEELRKAGKRDLISGYISSLKPDRATYLMARVFQDVKEVAERNEMVKLLEEKLNLVSVLNIQLRDLLINLKNEKDTSKRFTTMLESTNDDLWPAQRIGVKNIPDSTSKADEALVTGLEWYSIVHGHYAANVEALSLALRTALVSRHFACARLIIENNPIDEIFRSKSLQQYGIGLDIDDQRLAVDEAQQATWKEMRDQAETYLQLTQLMTAFEALIDLRQQEDASRARNVKSAPKGLKDQFAKLEESMQPLLSSQGFLLNAKDEDEARDLALIREIYLTEAIIGYNTVLYSSSQTMTRDHLITSMDLATIIASDEGGDLTDIFIKAGRMQELVKSFAYSSRKILLAKENGKTWRPKGAKRSGKTAEIWDVSVKEATVNGYGELHDEDEDEEEFDAMD